ncbi:AAA family ATPase [Vibrio cyclitrophicus]|uniref:AAA domain protein n=1 Tax=Vibrio phage 1.202.O._10N.222.45.E8 TaxID=1881262 RepID=A0A2I7RNF1_9CAUD|nr:AAA family ATPase [Vibrio cyclitrophicus]YP_009812510.1 AAA family ATPase [Vibrio phage 1.202.O._10N.222.45.E8]AUR95183.1 AAA domain protein [Vibrio phage 1.202.O._10N.222.45.E8]PMP49457.1 hypothetical protein BCS84_06800 [Vibrio cyclitrophicus]
MKFDIENLGKIKQANIELKDLTIICGPNSSNKTWLSYFINHSLQTVNHSLANTAMHINDELSKEVDALIKEGEASIDLDKHFHVFERAFELCTTIALDKLPGYFNLSSNTFSDTHFTLDTGFCLNKTKGTTIDGRRVQLIKEPNSNIAKIEFDLSETNPKLLSAGFFRHLMRREVYSSLAKVYLSDSTLNPFVITSERTGCMVFQPEIDRSTIKAKEVFSELERFSELESLPPEVFETLEELSHGEQYTYASPVKHNVNVIRDANLKMREDSFIAEHHPEVLEAMNKVNGGTFSYANSQLMFTTEDESNTLPVSISSSSIKSLFLLDLYIKSIAGPNDLLLIDEPELNLHPDNQRLMARVIARLVNTGVKVLITTHSDYLIREINNSIMLSNEFDEKEAIMQSHGFKQSDILKPTQVSAYMVGNEGNKAVVSEMKVGQLGINTQIFDCIINSANQLQSEIYFNLDDVDE